MASPLQGIVVLHWTMRSLIPSAAARERETAANRGYVGSDEHRRVFSDYVGQTLDRPKA